MKAGTRRATKRGVYAVNEDRKQNNKFKGNEVFYFYYPFTKQMIKDIVGKKKFGQEGGYEMTDKNGIANKVAKRVSAEESLTLEEYRKRQRHLKGADIVDILDKITAHQNRHKRGERSK